MAKRSSTQPPAWPREALVDPHGAADKAQRVRRMFAAIAPAYDLNNRLHSLGRDQAWRRAAVKMAQLAPGDVVLDVACGTGDLALAFLAGGARRVLGVDFTLPMLEIARRKGQAPRTESKIRRGGGQGEAQAKTGHTVSGSEITAHRTPQTPNLPPQALFFSAGDALRLPVADESVDVVSIAFGIRNVTDAAGAIAEFHRVLRPGGRVVILEFSLPRQRLLRGLYQFYFNHVLPRTAALIAADRSGAYRYLPRSVNTFLDRQGMSDLLLGAGFAQVGLRALTLGVAVVYRGVKEKGAR